MKKVFNIREYGAESGSKELQTKAIQAALDECKGTGGVVEIPKGEYLVSGLYVYSNTTVHLQAGAKLIGSSNCNDYIIFDIPDRVQMRTDLDMIPNYEGLVIRDEYRRAILTIYGEKNVSIIGEEGSIIDGVDCYDYEGEEGCRGPHAIFISSCENVLLKGYTVQNSGNFAHEMNNSRNIRVENVTCLAGHDGFHLHCSKEVVFEGCKIHTGDDCISGIDIHNVTVKNCDLNTSCNLFRIGGVHILVENCTMKGPGVYPHRLTIIPERGTPEGWKSIRPISEGRHSTLRMVEYFAAESEFMPKEPAQDIIFRNCVVDDIDRVLYYDYNVNVIQEGIPLKNLTIENVKFTNLAAPSIAHAPEEEPFELILKNVEYSYKEAIENDEIFVGMVSGNIGGKSSEWGFLDGTERNTKVVIE